MVDEVPPEAVVTIGKPDAAPDEHRPSARILGSRLAVRGGRRIVRGNLYMNDELWDLALDPTSAVTK